MVCDSGPNPRSEPLVCGDVLSIRELVRREWHKQSGHTKRSMVGVLGIIGPTRLNYAKIIPAVDYTAQVVSRLIK